MPSPEKFNEALTTFAVDDAVIAQINDGYAGLCGASPKKQRAAYFARAVDILRTQAPDKLQPVLESGACCKTGARLKASRAFARENAALSMEEKLQKLAAVPLMGRPEQNADGSFTVHAVHWWDDTLGRYRCACPTFNGVPLTQPVDKGYCFCCAGHFKFHYEILLGARLHVREVVSSPLASCGEQPCVMILEFAD